MPSYTVHFATWADNAAIGTKPWNLPGNAEFVDTAVAGATSNLGAGSHYLVGSAPTAFSPGAGEILDSIVATITREGVPIMPPGTTTVVDQHFYLVKAGVFASAIDKADTSTTWPLNAFGNAVYTWSKADLSTLGITLADCANAGFGVAFSCIGNAPGTTGAGVDAIVLTINTVTPVILRKGAQAPPYSRGMQVIA